MIIKIETEKDFEDYLIQNWNKCIEYVNLERKRNHWPEQGVVLFNKIFDKQCEYLKKCLNEINFNGQLISIDQAINHANDICFPEWISKNNIIE